MSDQLNSSNEESTARRVTRSRMKVESPPEGADTASRKATRSIEVLSAAVVGSPRRIRGRRPSTDDRDVETPPPIRALRNNRRVSVDRESATGTPKLVEDSSENESKPLLRRSRRLSVERDTATSSTPKRMGVLEPVSENDNESDTRKETEPETSPAKTEQPSASSSVMKRFGSMMNNFIDKIPLTRHSFSLNSDNDSDSANKTGSPSRGKKTVDWNKTLDKDFKLENALPRVEIPALEDMAQLENQGERKVSPKKHHLARFMDTVPKSRHSMSSANVEEHSEGKERTEQKSPLNKSLDKNFRSRTNSEGCTPQKQSKDTCSVGSLSLDSDEESDGPAVTKKSHLSVFSEKTVEQRHSIVGDIPNGSPAKKGGNLNMTLDKNFKAKAESSESEDESSRDEEEQPEHNSADKSATKSPTKSPKVPVAGSPRKSLKEFRAEQEAGDDEESKGTVSSKDKMIRAILERTIQERIEKEIDEDPEQDSSDDEEGEQDAVVADDAQSSQQTGIDSAPSAAASKLEQVEKDEDTSDEDDAAEEDESDDDDGSVCKFEMEDRVEEGDSAEEGEEDEEPEEDVVINTKKLKTLEPPTKVSEIMNKCQNFLVTIKEEKKAQRTVDEEKREKKKERKEARRKKQEAERARKEELRAKQEAQKQFVEMKNQEMVKQRRVEHKDNVQNGTLKETNKKVEPKTKDVPKQALDKKQKTGDPVIKKLDKLFASNVKKEKTNAAGESRENYPRPSKKEKKKLKILQTTEGPSQMAANLQKTKAQKKRRNGDEDEHVPKKRPELVPDKKYHQLAKDEKKRWNQLKDELKRQQGKPLKKVVKEPLRVLPKPVWTSSGEFEIEELKSPVAVKSLKRSNGTDFQVEVLAENGGGVHSKDLSKEQFYSKNIRREDSHNLLKRRKFY